MAEANIYSPIITKALIPIGILIIVAINIFIIMHNIHAKDILNKIKEKRSFIILLYIVSILSIICCIAVIIHDIIQIKTEIKISSEIEEKESIVKQEELFYNQKMQETYNTSLCSNPYIPTGFKYVEGDTNTGFVIEDTLGNQYVWVPCSNTDGDNYIKLQKSNFGHYVLLNYRDCNDVEYEDFIKSSLTNGGFYISRYEIGKENNTPTSKKDVPIWNGLTRNQAKEIVAQMYEGNQEINCKIINGFGWDTAYAWIQENNDVEKYYYEYTDDMRSGRNSYNNIYDLTDNMLEITSENCYDNPIVRGFNKIENSDYENETRYTVYDEDSTRIYGSEFTAVRTVIYK